MIGIFRLALYGLPVLVVLYFLLAIYSRSIRREKLEDEWDEDIQEGDRDAFIEAGMQDYEGSLRKKLILLVFVVPIVVVVGLVYVTNFM